MEAVSSINWTLFSIVSLEFIIGTFTNFFISFGIFSAYWKHQQVSGCEKIIAALSVSNLCYALASFGQILIFTIRPLLIMTPIYPALFVTTFFFLISSAWLTASLCFYYYVKIKSFSSDLLSRLKMKINSFTSWMIVMSVLLSLLCSLLNVIQILVQIKPSITKPPIPEPPIGISMFSNASQPYISYCILDSNLYIAFVSSFIPFFISVTTTASVTWSLHLHKLKMVRNQTSPANSNVRRYEGTIKIMICLLAFYALIYMALCLFYFNVFDPFSPGFWGFLVILCSYSPLQSILLSLSTTKLKRAWRKMFNCNVESNDDGDNREE